MPPKQPDSYRTLANSATAEPPKTKGSRFIGEAFPVNNADQALSQLDEIRRREHAATHHCWAYRLGAEGEEFRYSDDGEPYGSAGIPILREIEGRGLSDTMVVVTRYYGGTKLGTGGLVRAYSEAARVVLDEAPKRLVVVRVPLLLRFAFGDTSPAMQLINRFDVEIGETTYSEEGTALVLHVRKSEAELLISAFVEATAGRGEIMVVGSDD